MCFSIFTESSCHCHDEIRKPLKENTRVNHCYIGLQGDFLDLTTKVPAIKRKWVSRMSPELKTFMLRRIPSEPVIAPCDGPMAMTD